mgnify:CR=1 FL=1
MQNAFEQLRLIDRLAATSFAWRQDRGESEVKSHGKASSRTFRADGKVEHGVESHLQKRKDDQNDQTADGWENAMDVLSALAGLGACRRDSRRPSTRLRSACKSQDSTRNEWLCSDICG